MNSRNLGLFSIVGLIVIIIICSVTNACPPPGPDGSGGSGGSGCGSGASGGPSGGEPIDLTNGYFYSSTTDLVVKGRLRDVVIKRYYTSADTSKVRMDASDFFTQQQVQVYQVYWTPPSQAQNVWSSSDGKILECTFNSSGSYQFSCLVYYRYGSYPYTYAQQTYTHR